MNYTKLAVTQGLNAAGAPEEQGISQNHAHVRGSLIEYFWTAAGTTNAPDPTDIPNGAIGANQSGIASANVYHVVGASWVDTGAVVSNLYGA